MNPFDDKSSIGIPLTPHYYFGMIRVLPVEQRKGYAKRLMNHIINSSESDDNSSGVCLSTELPENVPFYEHFGFKVTSKAKTSDFYTWCLFYSKKVR